MQKLYVPRRVYFHATEWLQNFDYRVVELDTIIIIVLPPLELFWLIAQDQVTKMQEPVGVMRWKTLRHLQAAIFHPNPVMNVKLSASTNCVPPLEGRLGDLQPILPDSLHLLLSLPAFKSAFKPSWHSLQAEYFTLPGPMNIPGGNLSHKIQICNTPFTPSYKRK